MANSTHRLQNRNYLLSAKVTNKWIHQSKSTSHCSKVNGISMLDWEPTVEWESIDNKANLLFSYGAFAVGLSGQLTAIGLGHYFGWHQKTLMFVFALVKGRSNGSILELVLQTTLAYVDLIIIQSFWSHENASIIVYVASLCSLPLGLRHERLSTLLPSQTLFP